MSQSFLNGKQMTENGRLASLLVLLAFLMSVSAVGAPMPNTPIAAAMAQAMAMNVNAQMQNMMKPKPFMSENPPQSGTFALFKAMKEQSQMNEAHRREVEQKMAKSLANDMKAQNAKNPISQTVQKVNSVQDKAKLQKEVELKLKIASAIVSPKAQPKEPLLTKSMFDLMKEQQIKLKQQKQLAAELELQKSLAEITKSKQSMNMAFNKALLENRQAKLQKQLEAKKQFAAQLAMAMGGPKFYDLRGTKTRKVIEFKPNATKDLEGSPTTVLKTPNLLNELNQALEQSKRSANKKQTASALPQMDASQSALDQALKAQQSAAIGNFILKSLEIQKQSIMQKQQKAQSQFAKSIAEAMKASTKPIMTQETIRLALEAQQKQAQQNQLIAQQKMSAQLFESMKGKQIKAPLNGQPVTFFPFVKPVYIKLLLQAQGPIVPVTVPPCMKPVYNKPTLQAQGQIAPVMLLPFMGPKTLNQLFRPRIELELSNNTLKKAIANSLETSKTQNQPSTAVDITKVVEDPLITILPLQEDTGIRDESIAHQPERIFQERF